MENINVDLNEFELPIHIFYDNEYYKTLVTKFDKYCRYINKIQELGQKCKDKVNENCESILECIEMYYNANIIGAQDRIAKNVRQYIKSDFIVAQSDENYAFRGMAPKKIRSKIYENNDEYYEEMLKTKIHFYKARVTIDDLDSKDMLHIPFDKRGIISTQRYSIPGVPCLYLASTSYGAWRELDMPESEKFNVSAYELPTGLRILNLCIQQHLINGASSVIGNDKELKNLEELIELFPLVIATSFSVLEMDRNFRSEYIVSQLVMQVAKKLNIDGVAYLSTKVSDAYAYPTAINLAILIPSDVKSDKKYWDRGNEIALTKPIKFSRFLQHMNIEQTLKKDDCMTYVNRIYFDYQLNMIEIYKTTCPYVESSFAKFDEYIVRQKFQKFSEK